MPRFDDEGRLNAGTKLLTDDRYSTSVILSANDLEFKVYYQYKDENGDDKRTSVHIRPRKGQSEDVWTLLDYMDNVSSQDDSQSGRSLNAMIKQQKYNEKFVSGLTQWGFDSMDISDNEELTMETITVYNPGNNSVSELELVKIQKEGNPDATLKIRFVGGDFLGVDKNGEYTNDKSKIMYDFETSGSQDVGHAKVFLADILNL